MATEEEKHYTSTCMYFILAARQGCFMPCACGHEIKTVELKVQTRPVSQLAIADKVAHIPIQVKDKQISFMGSNLALGA
jgi:hypothetical protein